MPGLYGKGRNNYRNSKRNAKLNPEDAVTVATIAADKAYSAYSLSDGTEYAVRIARDRETNARAFAARVVTDHAEAVRVEASRVAAKAARAEAASKATKVEALRELKQYLVDDIIAIISIYVWCFSFEAEYT